jgi:hypothetical protein
LVITPIDLQTGSTAPPAPPLTTNDSAIGGGNAVHLYGLRDQGMPLGSQCMTVWGHGLRLIATWNHKTLQPSLGVLPLRCASASPGDIEDMAAVPFPDASSPASALGDRDGGTSPFCVASAQDGGLGLALKSHR